MRIAVITVMLIAFYQVASAQSLNKSNLNLRGKAKHNGLMRTAQFESDKGTFFYAYTDATRRGSVIFIDRCGQHHVLSESSPDAANEKQIVVNTTVKVKDKAQAEAYANALNKIQALGKRNASVNIIRDQLYKLNELVNNVSYFNCDTGLVTIKVYKDSCIRLCTIDSTTLYVRVNSVTVRDSTLVTKKCRDTIISIGKDTLIKNNGKIYAGSLFNREAITNLYETAFNNIKDIAIAESNAEARLAEAQRDIAKIRADSAILANIGRLNLKLDTLKTDINKTVNDKSKQLLDSLQASRKEITDLKKKIEELKPAGKKEDETKKWKLNIDATLKEEN